MAPRLDTSAGGDPATLRKSSAVVHDLQFAQAELDGGVPSAAKARYDEALRAILDDPTDVEANFEFADAAVAVGDVNGAIAALERILLVEPDRPDIKLRLGQLYQMVGAYELAETYLSGGLQARDIPERFREQAELLFDEVGQQRLLAERRHILQGSLFVGGGWQTNANAGPGSNNIRLFGFEGPFLADEDKEESDFSGFASADLDYFYDFGSQAGHRLEADVLAFGERFADVSESNTALLDVQLGPRYFIRPAIAGETEFRPVSVRPFLSGNALYLDDDHYRTGFGGGINAAATLADNLGIEFNGLALYQNYDNTSREQTASNLTGPQTQFNAQLLWFPANDTLLTFEALAGHRDADEDFESFVEWGGAVSVTQFFRPIDGWLTERPWSASLAGAYRNTDYDEADPTIDPDQEQSDDRWDLTAQLSTPLAEQLSVNFTFQYTNNDSNLPNDDYDNYSYQVALRYTF